jgi:hypothetical protein
LSSISNKGRDSSAIHIFRISEILKLSNDGIIVR